MTTHAAPQTPALDAAPVSSAPASSAPADSSGLIDDRVRSHLAAWLGLGAVAVMAALVFWVFEALPFQDLPAHAGLIAMRHRFAESAFEQRFYVLAPHIGPYSLFRLLGEGFVRVIGPLGAVRALATLPALATPAALLFARRRLHGDRSPTFGFIGISLSFGLMTLLGFASYLLGVAVMLVGLTLWLELMAEADTAVSLCDTQRRELFIAGFAPLIFLAHGHAFVLFLLLAGTATIATGDRVRRLLRLRSLVPAVSLAAWVAWIERGTTTPPGSVSVTAAPLAPHFQGVYDKLTLLITPTLMTRTGVDFAAGLLLWALAIASTVATLRSLRASSADSTAPDAMHSRALYAGALLIGIVFLALPHAIGWFGFVDGRLVLVVMLLVLLAVRRQALGRTLRNAFDRGGPFIAFAMTSLALVASYRFQAESRGYHEVLAKVPAYARLLNLPLDPNSDIFTAHPFIHYDKLVLVERPIVVSDVWFHQGSALYPTPENPALRLPSSYSESDLRGIDWPAYKLQDWDYVLIRTRPDGPAPASPDSLTLDEHRGGWWLYRANANANVKSSAGQPH